MRAHECVAPVPIKMPINGRACRRRIAVNKMYRLTRHTLHLCDLPRIIPNRERPEITRLTAPARIKSASIEKAVNHYWTTLEKRFIQALRNALNKEKIAFFYPKCPKKSRKLCSYSNKSVNEGKSY